MWGVLLSKRALSSTEWRGNSRMYRLTDKLVLAFIQFNNGVVSSHCFFLQQGNTIERGFKIKETGTNIILIKLT